MTTVYLGVEELIARRQPEAMDLATRHTWRLADFWRAETQQRRLSIRSVADKMAQSVELVEMSRLQLRWAMW